MLVVPEPLTTIFFVDPKNVVLSAVGAAPNVLILCALKLSYYQEKVLHLLSVL